MPKEEVNDFANTLYRNGFLHIKNVISYNEIVNVRRCIDELFDKYSNLPEKYRAIHLARDNEANDICIREISHATKLLPLLAATHLVKQCKAIAIAICGKKSYLSYDHAIYKPPYSGSVSWHQDQAYKEKVRRMKSLHFWIPLHDICSDNGCMQYIPGSVDEKIHAHNKHPLTCTLSIDEIHINENKIVRCDVKAGDVLIHLPSTLHSSVPNNTSTTRKAWILHFSPYGRFEPVLPQNIFWYLIRKIAPNTAR